MLAWLLGETIIVTRSVSREHRPPSPGALLASSGFFALCALLAEYPPARGAATLLAFGIDLAAYLEAPVITQGKQGKTAKQQKQASGLPPGTVGRAPA